VRESHLIHCLSGSYLYQVIGDLKYADRVEQVAYNALPATLTGGKDEVLIVYLLTVIS
jgi:hypothetical protein